MSELNTVYNITVDKDIVEFNVKRIQGQIFKLLPTYEEEKDYKKPLQTLITETLGMSSLLPQEPKIFSLACKLQGIYNDDMDYMTLRRTIFDCCGLCGDVRDAL